MATTPAAAPELLAFGDLRIEVDRRGSGAPLLLLGSEDALERDGALVEELARDHEVILPSPPGFGRSNRPDWVTCPDDMSYVMLDVVDRLGLRDVTVVGFSLGGWIAAEMATKDDGFISKLVLVDPFGIKVGGPLDRDIADIYLLSAAQVAKLKWHDLEKGKRDYPAMPEDELSIIARNNESFARFCWEPYMHNPKLSRRLHRISVPTLLVWGREDGIVTPAYGEAYRKLIPGARLEVIPDAGHLPHIEQPAAFLRAVRTFFGKYSMIAWHFTEMPYPDIPPLDTLPSTRVTLPNRYCDPKVAADLYNRYLDEHVIADELGFNIMLNEHHQAATCIDSAAPLPAAILARQTKNARICILGNPIANRGEPVRIAEEMAMIDCISRGRLDCGFVRGVPFEIFGANTNPTQTLERLWEGVDLAVKAWTTLDGPFNYEGRFWHKRAVNIWPRPYQQPHPPIWITGSSDMENIAKIAGKGYTFATFLQPHQKVRQMFETYRAHYVDNGIPHCGGMAYMPLVYTADSENEAMAGANELLWYINAAKGEPQFRNPPGYVPIPFNVRALQGAYTGRTDAMRSGGNEFLMEQGVLIAGTPDSVVKQIKRFYDLVGGFDHLLCMQQAGHLDHERTVRSMTLFAKEVMPAIAELPSVTSKLERVVA